MNETVPDPVLVSVPDPVFGPDQSSDHGAPLSSGKHTIHLGGRFHFNAGDLGDDPFDLSVDITINLTVK